MSKVKIQNVSKSHSPFYCGLADNSSLALQYGQSEIVEKSLITPYIERRAKVGDLLLTEVIQKTDATKVKEDSDKQDKAKGGKKTTNTNKEV